MKGRLPIALFATALFAIVFGLAGCDSAPSTPLAPDKPAPDASKMSPEEVQRMLKQNGAGGDRKR